MNIAIVIMAGGAGTRFWPLSTDETPKQFLKLLGDRSMLQESYLRVKDIVTPDRVLVLTNKAYVGIVRDQLPDLPEENIIGEPMRRDTAAAVAFASLLCRARFGNPVMAVLTADHYIEPVELFHSTLLSAIKRAAKERVLYTFGIRPSYPATGYGYLERGAHILSDDGIEHYEMLRFKEKPDAETARGYVDSGRYYWNSGMFIWQTDVILDELNRQLPAHIASLGSAIGPDGGLLGDDELREAFEPVESTSIDFGVMEKAETVCCVEATFNWSDLGGWLSLRNFIDHDSHDNYHHGDIIVSDATGNLVFCDDPDDRVMLIGVNDLVVIRAGSNTLVVHKDKVEEVKKLVNEYIRK